MKIDIKIHDEACKPYFNPDGDWIDLRAAEDVEIKAPVLNVHTNQIELHTGLISLGVSMRMPEGFEAILAPRSSTLKNFGIICANSIGVIDNSYNGTNDVWRFPFIGIRNATIKKGDRIAQFRVQRTQSSMFGEGITLNVCEELNDKDRGGFGTSGKS